MDYNNNNKIKTQLTNNIVSTIINSEDPLNKQISYDAIHIESERLMNREKMLFTINTIVVIGLFIAIFKTT